MKPVRPKLVPTLICFTIVAVITVILPYPGLENQVTVISNTSNTTSRK